MKSIIIRLFGWLVPVAFIPFFFASWWLPVANSSKLDPRARAALHYLGTGKDYQELMAAGVAINEGGDLDVFISGPISRKELEELGVKVRTSLPGLCTAFVPLESLKKLTRNSRVNRIQGAAPMKRMLDRTVSLSGVSALRGNGPEFAGRNGKGVIIGAIDSGIDYDHPDFQNEDGSTRILYIWDQTSGDTTLASAPAGFQYGLEWDSASINQKRCTQLDPNSHGTHVMGIAAGDGSGTGNGFPEYTYAGLAPKADIIMVKTDYLPSTKIIDGIAYIFRKADESGKNAVVNLSLGFHLGPHDGTSPLERAVDLLAGPGKIICTAAGNLRGLPWHAEALASTDSNYVTFEVAGADSLSRIYLDGYYDASERLDVLLITPKGDEIGPIRLGSENVPYPGESTAAGLVYVYHDSAGYSAVNREVYVEIQGIPAANPDGLWTLTFIPVELTDARGEIDLWLTGSDVSVAFRTGNQPEEEMIIEPGNAFHVITVGAYSSREDWRDCNDNLLLDPVFSSPAGTLASFSCPGPTRDGRLKPDVTAPGVWIASTNSFDYDPRCPAPGTGSRLLADSLHHRMGLGTSASTPHVTGVCALILQVEGALSAEAIKEYLFQNVRVDSFTGTVPNKNWGYGKLYLDTTMIVSAARPSATEPDIVLWPNPSAGPVWISISNPGRLPVQVDMLDLAGKKLLSLEPNREQTGDSVILRWHGRAENGVTLPSGIYLVQVMVGRKVYVRRLVLLGD